MHFPRRQRPPELVDQARELMATHGLNENPSDVVLLLLSEVQSLNGRLVYTLGVLSVLAALLMAHILA